MLGLFDLLVIVVFKAKRAVKVSKHSASPSLTRRQAEGLATYGGGGQAPPLIAQY